MEQRVVKFDLMPGAELLCYQTDRFKTGCLSLSFLRNVKKEELSKNALLMPVLLRGTSQYPDISALSGALDNLYGADFGVHLRKKGDAQQFGISGDFIDDRFSFEGGILEGSCELLCQMLLDPAGGGFLPEYFSSERDNLRDAIQASRNNKSAWALRRLFEIMCPGESSALNRLGTEEELAKVTNEGLRQHWQYLLQNGRMILFYGGSEEPERVRQLLLRGLSSLSGRPDPAPLTPTVRKRAGQLKQVTETMDVAQGKLCMGWRFDRDDGLPYGPSVLFNAIYGGTSTSRLFLNVREKLSLCYSVDSSVDRRKGMMVVTAGVDFDDYEKCRDEVFRQLEQCRQGQISPEELALAKIWAANAIRSGGDSLNSLEDYYVTRAMEGSPLIPPRELIPLIEQTTVEDVAALAAQAVPDTIYFLRGNGEGDEDE